MSTNLAHLPIEYLFCRGWAHEWQYGAARVEVEKRRVPKVWSSRSSCPNCHTKRAVWLEPQTCRPLKVQPEYEYQPGPTDYLKAMHNITRDEARAEIARRAKLPTRHRVRTEQGATG